MAETGTLKTALISVPLGPGHMLKVVTLKMIDPRAMGHKRLHGANARCEGFWL